MLILQVTTAAVEQYYTGVGKPPYCEMTLRAADGSTPPDLTLPVILSGVKQPTTITLERVAETTDGVVCPPITPLTKSPGQFLSQCELFYEILQVLPNLSVKSSIIRKETTVGRQHLHFILRIKPR